MPYIHKCLRKDIDHEISILIDTISTELPANRAGMLNYTISRIVTESINDPDLCLGWSYNQITEAIATFQCAQDEFNRRIVGPKEDRSIAENGDLPAYES